MDLDDTLPDRDRDFLLLGLPLLDFERERLLALADFGLAERDLEDLLDLGLWDWDLGLWDFPLWDPDLRLCAPDLGLAERDFGEPEPERALADPERDLDLDFDARLGLPEAFDFGLEEADLLLPDLLLWAEPERLEPAGEFDLLREALEDFWERDLAEPLDLADSLPERAALPERDL